MRSSTVSAIVVSYNVRRLLLACIASLEAARSVGALQEIIIVDNNSSDGSAEAVREQYPDVVVIDAPNLGYGAGANRGIAASSGDYVLILNPDTIVPSETVCRLTAELKQNPQVAISAPRLRYPGGNLQPSRRRFPTRFTPLFESTIIESWWPGNPWVRAYRLDDRHEAAVQAVDWVVGACLMVRKSALELAGGFDEDFWMYCEETEWCWRLQRHGWRVLYVPDVEIVHYEGASSSQNMPQRQLAFDRSRIELQRRLHGRANAVIIALGIRSSYLLHLLIEAGKFALGHRRDLRRQRITFYSRLLRSSLQFQAGSAHD